MLILIFSVNFLIMDAKINVYPLLTTLYRFIFIIDNIQMSRNVSRNVCNYILT